MGCQPAKITPNPGILPNLVSPALINLSPKLEYAKNPSGTFPPIRGSKTNLKRIDLQSPPEENMRDIEKGTNAKKTAMFIRHNSFVEHVDEPHDILNNTSTLSLPFFSVPMAGKTTHVQQASKFSRPIAKTPDIGLRIPRSSDNNTLDLCYARSLPRNIRPKITFGVEAHGLELEENSLSDSEYTHNKERYNKSLRRAPTIGHLLVDLPNPNKVSLRKQTPNLNTAAERIEEDGEDQNIIRFKINRRRVKLIKKEEFVPKPLPQVSRSPSPSYPVLRSQRDLQSEYGGSQGSNLTFPLVHTSFKDNSVKHSQASKTLKADGSLKVNQYEMHQKIGKGAFGEVRKALNTIDKKYYAIKIIQGKKQQLRLGMGMDSNNEAECILGEIATYKKLVG